ncbi:hypothetical protein [Oceanicola sp. S124]|uniref:hypothetical protein n=1 Tax=Oceanicola sp. S124 TaxID=1042378 RepID=UPI0002558991|nr:hypothetical protein [Oceanicola sp. S124]
MSRSRPPQVAFSSGEISPLLHARNDYQRFQTGLRSCVGYLPLRQGGVTRAPGTIFRGYTRNNAPARLVPFEFAVNDALTLEFTDGYMRVWRYGALVQSEGAPFELEVPYDQAAIARLSWVQSADVIYLADGVLPVQKLSRFALDNWAIEPASFTTGPFRVQNLDEALTIQASAASGSITLTGTGGIFTADWVGSLIRLLPDGYDDIPLWTSNTEVAVGDLMRNAGNIYEVAAGTNTGAVSPVHEDGTELVDKNEGIKWTYVSDGTGIVRVTGYTDANSVTAEVLKVLPPPVVTAPTYRWSEGAWSPRRGYPAQLEIYDQSLVAGFTPEEPRTVWFSTLGDFADFEPSIEADGSFAYTISGSRSLNAGQWLMKARRGLYIGALGEVIRGFSNTTGQRIGPTTFDTQIEATDGTAPVKPIAPYTYPIFVTKEASRVMEIRYSLEDDGGRPLELSLPSQHLGFEGFLDMVWQSAPQRLAWLRRGNGELAAMIYDPDQDVLGWAPCPVAGGEVETMAVTTDATTGNDILTMVVKRDIDGQTVRMVEEQAVTWGVIAGDSPMHEAVHFFASAIFAPEEPTDSFSVPHLVGEDVYVWTDAGEYGPITVPAGGEISIDAPVSHAVVGLLDETHEVITLNVTIPAPDGDARGRKRRLHSQNGVMLHRTAAGRFQVIEKDFGQPERVGPAADLVPRSVAADLTQAVSGVASLDAASGHCDEVFLRFSPYGGAPMTILGWVADAEEVGA